MDHILPPKIFVLFYKKSKMSRNALIIRLLLPAY